MRNLFLLLLCFFSWTATADADRFYYHSTILYGDSYFLKDGFHMYRGVGEANFLCDTPAFSTANLKVSFKIIKISSPAASLQIGLFEKILPDPKYRAVDEGTSFGVTCNRTKGSMDLYERKNLGNKTLKTFPFVWQFGKEYSLHIVKDEKGTTFYLDGKEVGRGAPHGKVQLAATACRIHFVITGLEGTADGKTVVSSSDTDKKLWKPLDFGIEHFLAAEKAGAEQYLIYVSFDDFWRDNGDYDFTDLGTRLDMLSARLKNPKFIIRLSMRSNWWAQKNPSENQTAITTDGKKLVGPGYCKISFASQKWMQESGRALEALLRFCEKSPFSSKITGYNLLAGDGGEWSYGFRSYLSDYSKPQETSFREYVKEKYNNDIGLLNKAWSSREQNFDTISLPDYKARLQGDLGIFFSPEKSQKIIDFNRHLSLTVADAIAYMAKLVRKEAPGKICCIYYGYHFMPGDNTGELGNTGHRALAEVLRNPDIDILGAPQQYYFRKAGGSALSQLPAKSLALNGKRFLNENDCRTFLTAVHSPGMIGITEYTLEASRAVLLRNAAYSLSRENSIEMWMEMGTNWYNHQEFIRMAQYFHSPEFRNYQMPEVAVVVSDRSYDHMCFTNALSAPLLAKTMMHAVAKSGAPFETILLSDLEKAQSYKLYIFMDCCILDQKTREGILRKLKKDKATALWMYAPGIGDARTLDLRLTEELTGFSLKMLREPVAITLPEGSMELKAELAPVLYSDQPVIGTDYAILKTQKGLVLNSPIGIFKKMDNSWNSVWCGMPVISDGMLRRIFRKAGVHVFSDAGDQVLYNGKLLVIHTDKSCEREVTLPDDRSVTELFTGQRILVKNRQFKLKFEKNDTGAFLLVK